MEKIHYYKDELNDEFSEAQIKTKKIDGSYKYKRNSFLRFFWYRIIFYPIAYFYCLFKFHHKTVNRKVFKKVKGAYFMYGNHTQQVGDPFLYNMLNFPKDNFVIVHPNNVSIPFLGRINSYLGAIPLPDDLKAMKNFMKTIQEKVTKKKAIIIFPEAHIWPYYTKIRPFKEDSFHYPVKENVPVYCFTNTYQKRKFGKGVNITTYCDGPFYIDYSLKTAQEKKLDLRNRVYNTMVERSKNSNIEVVKYIKMEEKNND